MPLLPLLLTDFTHCSDVSIVDFEQVNADWVIVIQNHCTAGNREKFHLQWVHWIEMLRHWGFNFALCLAQCIEASMEPLVKETLKWVYLFSRGIEMEHWLKMGSSKLARSSRFRLSMNYYEENRILLKKLYLDKRNISD